MEMTVKIIITILLFSAAYAVNVRYIHIRIENNLSLKGVPTNLLFTFVVLFGWLFALDLLLLKAPKTYLSFMAVGVLLVVYTVIALHECKKIRDKA